MKNPKALIVTADDFGVSLPVNEAVERAHREGILSAASLMTGAPAFADAAERARRLPGLGVGLHIVLIDSVPVLPVEQVPDLVGPDGRFFNNPEKFGFNLFFSREMRRQAEAEIRAQFERFETTGLAMDHINGHHHFHMHPVVTDAIATLAPRHGSPPVRMPVEPFWPSWRAIADRPLQRFFNWIFFSSLTYRMRGKLKAAGLRFNDQVFGINDSGAMTEARILAYLDHLPPGVTELYCHPATGAWSGPDRFPETYLAADEFHGLISPAVRAKLATLGLSQRSFRATFT